MGVPIILSAPARAVGAWFAPYMAGSIIMTLVCIAGLWKMKRWAAYLYAVVAVTNQLIVYSAGTWRLPDLLVPAAFAATAFSQIGKMR